MNDQEFLRDLARVALEEEEAERSRWERWDRLNDGDLSAEQEVELRALASTSNEAEKAYEAFRPFSPDFRARVAAAIGPLGAAEPAPAPATPPARAGEPRRNREPERPWRSRFLGWRAALGSSGLAAAAALFLLLRLPALPEFAFKVAGASPFRGAAEEVFTPDGIFHAEIIPKVGLPRRAPLEPQCFVGPVDSAAGRINSVKCKVNHRTKRGAMQIEGRLPQSLPTGPATLWIVLAYPGHQPPSNKIENLPVDTRTLDERWIALPYAIEIRAP